MWGSVHIRRIVRVSQMLTRWRRKACPRTNSVPSDVPSGHVAVLVGSARRRFIIRTKHLNHPLIRLLLRKVEEEFGLRNNNGPIHLPCEESIFEDVLRVVTRSDRIQTFCRPSESIPLLARPAELTQC